MTRTNHLKVPMALVLLLVLGAIFARPAHAATFTVNSANDGGDQNTTNGVCDTGVLVFPSGEPVCTLRAAIQQSNATPGADTIGFSVGSVTLSVAGRSEELAATGDLDIRQDVTIEGNGATVTADDGFNDRIFHVISPARATIKGLSVARGEEIDGGGIYVAFGAKLDLIGGTVKENLAIDPDPNGEVQGGGIYNDGTMTVTRSTIKDNTSEASGGGRSHGAGLFHSGGTTTIADSTFSGNEAVSTSAASAASRGGAIYNETNLRLTNVTVSGNGAFGATSNGGGIYNSYDLRLTNGTLKENRAQFGANLFNYVGFSNGPVVSPFTAKNSIVTNPQGGGVNCSGFNGSLGNNLSSDGSCNFAATGDAQNRDPKLGALAGNGGPTRTHALLPGSPAIDAGNNTGCPGADQRGANRPQDGDGNGSATCDIGAFEVGLPPNTSIVSGPTGTTKAVSATFEFTSTEPGSTFLCSLDGGTFVLCSSPKRYSSLRDGSHTFRVRAVDALGNADPTPAVRTWAVDTVGPSITPTSPMPDSRTRDRTPLVAATVADDRTDLTGGGITLYLDGQKKSAFSYDPSTDSLTYTGDRLSLGTHTSRVTARDAAGNRSARSWSFEVVR